MQNHLYPAVIEEPYTNDFVVRFPDVPEAITGADTREEALVNAADALAVAVEQYLKLGREVPAPSPLRKGQYAVALDPAIAARVLLSRAMTHQSLSKVALAARMQRDEKVVRRILSGRGVSLDLMLDALRAVGVHPSLSVAD